MKFLGLVMKNLLRNKRRTMLTALSIAVSLFVFSALLTLPATVERTLNSASSSLRVHCQNKAGLAQPLPEAYRHRILAAKHVVKVCSWTWFGGLYTDVNSQFPNFGVDQEELDQIWPEWQIAPQAMKAMRQTRTAC